MTDQDSYKVLIQLITVDETHPKCRGERQVAYQDMVLDRSFLVQEAETEIQIILQKAGVLLSMDELGSDLVGRTLTLEPLQVVRTVFHRFTVLLILRCWLGSHCWFRFRGGRDLTVVRR